MPWKKPPEEPPSDGWTEDRVSGFLRGFGQPRESRPWPSRNIAVTVTNYAVEWSGWEMETEHWVYGWWRDPIYLGRPTEAGVPVMAQLMLDEDREYEHRTIHDEQFKDLDFGECWLHEAHVRSRRWGLGFTLRLDRTRFDTIREGLSGHRGETLPILSIGVHRRPDRKSEERVDPTNEGPEFRVHMVWFSSHPFGPLPTEKHPFAD